MGCISKAQTTQAVDLPTERVYVPEWADGDPSAYVNVRGMTAMEKDLWEASHIPDDPGDIPEKGKESKAAARIRRQKMTKEIMINARARLVSLTAVDDAGARIYGEEDIPMLSKKSGLVIDRIVEVAQRLSGMRQADLDDAVGNSETGRSDATASDSLASAAG